MLTLQPGWKQSHSCFLLGLCIGTKPSCPPEWQLLAGGPPRAEWYIDYPLQKKRPQNELPKWTEAQTKKRALPPKVFHSQPTTLTTLVSVSHLRMAADPTWIGPADDTFIFTEPFISVMGGKLCIASTHSGLFYLFSEHGKILCNRGRQMRENCWKASFWCVFYSFFLCFQAQKSGKIIHCALHQRTEPFNAYMLWCECNGSPWCGLRSQSLHTERN